jgi:hypothetical protein
MNTKAKTFHRIAVLCAAAALLAAAASAAGLLFRGGETTKEVVSVRGEEYEMVTDGVYAYNALRVVAEGIGWDAVSLFLAAPALLAAAFFIYRGSLRARLLALGLLAYFFYQYLMYAVYWDIGPLFPLYIIIYPLCIAAAAWTVTTIPVGRLPEIVSSSFPRKGIAVLSFIVAFVLLGMWSSRIAAVLSGEIQGQLFGQDSLDVQAFDLGLIVPLAVFTAVQVLRRKAVGYLLSVVLAVKAVTMAAAITAMLISAWTMEGRLELPPFLFFTFVSAVSLVLSFKMLTSIPGGRCE